MFISNFKNNLKKNLEFSNLLPQLVLIFIKKCFSLIEKKVDKGLARLVKTRNLRFQSKLQDFGSVANSGVGFLNVFHKILGGGVCDVNKLLVWFYCIFI